MISVVNVLKLDCTIAICCVLSTCVPQCTPTERYKQRFGHSMGFATKNKQYTSWTGNKKRNVWNEGRKSASTNKQQQKRPPWRCQWKKAYTPRLKEECWKKTWQRSWSNGVMRKNKHNEHQMDAVAIASSGFFPACLPRKKDEIKCATATERVD